MVTPDVQTTCRKDAQQADFLVVITSPGGTPGIDSVLVTAIDKSVLNKQNPPNCPTNYQFSVGAVPFTALPIYIEVTECISGVDVGQGKVKTSFGSYGRECVGIVDCKAPGQNQNNQSCITLQNEITKRRNQLLTQCGAAASLKSQRDAALAAAAAFLAASIAVAAIAFALNSNFWTLPAGIVLAVVSGVFLTASIAAGSSGLVLAAQLNDLQNLMTQERQDLSDLILRLRDVCCTEFINPMLWDVPVCPV